MLRIIQQSSAEGAKSYYSKADYYTEGQELVGNWRGLGADRLGLDGEIDKADWDRLVENRDPSTGKVLTPRQRENRRIGYDFNFHVPKSVSVLYAITEDPRLLAAFQTAVGETMQDIEREMQTRVRTRGRDENRTTGNMVWGEFIHKTARPVDGVPDPHLHAHCFVFNTTWDPEEGRWKAGQFVGLKRDAPYFEALFHSRLATEMGDLGLSVVRTKQGWELDGIPRATVQRFSRRTAAIEREAKARGITDPDKKGELGAKSRERKQLALGNAELRAEWLRRMPGDERDALREVAAKVGTAPLVEDVEEAREGVRQALEHSFERAAVRPERRVMAEALRRTLGAAAPRTVEREIVAQKLITGVRDGTKLVTTPLILAEEQRMLRYARDGRGSCSRLKDTPHAFARSRLNQDQRRAVTHLLSSRDRVMVVRGAAGTGKTEMAKEAVEAIQAGGRRVVMLAPSAEASRGVLRREGFEGAETVARFLVDENMQRDAKGQVLWIDEAGLVGSRTMQRVFDVARKVDARVILAGDRRQHASVERGSPLRLLEEEAGIVPAQLRAVLRQQGDYKRAVEALSRGDADAGFRELDWLGWVRVIPGEERVDALAGDYVASVLEGKTALVVSPTHAEGDRITSGIRRRLAEAGRLDGGERELWTLRPLDLTQAERSDAVNYQSGDVLVFHQNARGFTRGERLVVGDKRLPLDQAARFQVYRPSTLRVALGEVLRVTRNGKTADGRHRLNNGMRVTVEDFDRRGNLVLSNGWTLSRDYGHLAHGYVSTSHGSQGMTVQRVLIGQSTLSLPATSREQFYVSVSRGRERATVYTDDKEALLEAIGHSHERLSATELARHQVRTVQPTREQRLDMSKDSHTRTHERERELSHD